MYLYYFVHLDGEPWLWAGRLEGNLIRLGQIARVALRSVLREPPPADDSVMLGPSQPLGRGFWIPITWSAPGLFTGLSGELSVQPVNMAGSQISIRASYTPDHPGDLAEVHRMVETVVKRFLDSIQPVSQRGS